MIKERVQRLLESLIIGYQRAISPRFPPCCRYRPTCSAYALEENLNMEIFCKSVSSQRQKPESYRIHIYGLRASVECERGANIQPAEIESQI